MGSFHLEEIPQSKSSGVDQKMNKTFERIDASCNSGFLNDNCIKITMKSVLKALCRENEPLNVRAIMRIMRTNGYEHSTLDMSLAMDRLSNMGMVSEIIAKELHHQNIGPRIIVEKLYIIEPLTAIHVCTSEKGA